MNEFCYFVKRKGCAEDENTWTHPKCITNAQKEVILFHRENFEMPGLEEVE